MNKSILFLLITFLSIGVPAQDNDLKSEILDYQDSTLLLIKNSRKLIGKALDAGEYERAYNIRRLLAEEVDPEKYVTFSTSEDFLIAFLIGAPEVVLVTAAKWDSLDNSYSYAEQPGNDNLYDELLRISSRDRTNVELLINTPEVGLEEQRLLMMTFHLLLGDVPSQGITQESLNEEADQFLGFFPDSRYASFVKKAIRVKYVRADWGGVVFIGAGAGDFNEGLSVYVKMKTPVYVSFDSFYKNIFVGLRVQGGAGDVVQDFEFEGNWPVDLGVNPLYVGLGVGYAVLNKDKFRFTPFAELGGLSITPIESERNGDTGDLSLSSFTYGAGAMLDIMPFTSDSWIEQYRFGLRLFGGVLVHTMEQKDSRFTGTYPHFGMGLIMDVFRQNRDMR